MRSGAKPRGLPDPGSDTDSVFEVELRRIETLGRQILARYDAGEGECESDVPDYVFAVAGGGALTLAHRLQHPSERG